MPCSCRGAQQCALFLSESPIRHGGRIKQISLIISLLLIESKFQKRLDFGEVLCYLVLGDPLRSAEADLRLEKISRKDAKSLRKTNMLEAEMKHLILIALAGMGAAMAARADIIYVQGDVSGTWAADTVIVTGEVRVPPGQTLVIQPGVKVLFQVYCKFIVDTAATLNAVGTQHRPIRFDELVNGIHWHGIRFLHASSQSILEFCHIKNGLVSGSGSDLKGGGIFCSHSDISVKNCMINSCKASKGSGIYFEYSDLILINNLFYGNDTFSGPSEGGAINGHIANGEIKGNLIIVNGSLSTGSGGGMQITDANLAITGNFLADNWALNGGGMNFQNSACLLENNVFYSNVAGGGDFSSAHGGGIFCGGSNLTLSQCSFVENVASAFLIYSYGGAIYGSDLTINKCSFIGNSASAPSYGQGGIHLLNSTSEIQNSILWNNVPGQIYLGSGARVGVGFTDIQAGWPGLGNINAYPAFVDTAFDDYRLLWDSPCIDSGDPNVIYNDPDGTRADMGAFYYDQSVMVRILLSPHEIPYLIPETGGSMDYAIRAFNRDSLAHSTRIWCDMTFPDSSIHGPLLGPVRVLLGAGALLERVRTQNIPASAPMGVYHYNAYAVVESDTSKDSFMFGKLGTSNLSARTPSEELGTSNWTNTGEPITDVVGSRAMASNSTTPAEYALHPCSPNPFNATAVLNYQLPVAGYVSLRVYDIAGRVAETLVDGWREAGVHEVTFNAGDLPSGIYFCRLKAGAWTESGKMILLK